MTDLSRRSALLAAASLSAAGLATAAPKAMAKVAALLAPTPPMGWNSWDSFATTITEAQALDVAHIMAAKLKPHGYTVFTIDIQWYEGGATGFEYSKTPTPELDGYGRLLPAPNRFPSSAGGHGFKPLADQIHALGLKFGVHLMRGIPRLAVERNTPVLGTALHARDVANTNSTCPWNPDMYGVDMTKPGAQAYYNSVFALLASWGVDFVKMDDMSRPYDAHAPEIEAAHKAIVASGRPITLSLSPGETPVARADHVAQYAQMWRISDDFWDDWKLLEQQFTRLENWNSHRRPGAWPDGDMLPVGKLRMGQSDTNFTHDEQQTLLSLWCMARSPLIVGGDLRSLDDWTLDLLTNDEVLAINQTSRNNQPHFLADNQRIWTAEGKDCHYLALFNTSDKPETIGFNLSRIGFKSARVRDLWARQDIGQANGAVTAEVPRHGVKLLKLS